MIESLYAACYSEIRMSKALLILVILATVLFIPSRASAQEYMVDHIASPREKIVEKIGFWLKFSKEDKVRYYQKLLDKRLGEIAFGAATNVDLIEPTASRYATYVGNLINYIEANQINTQKDGLVKQFDLHSKAVKEIQSKYEYESGWWLALQHDINMLATAKEKVEGLK